MEDYNLTSTLIPGTITYEEGERQATVDLCLVTVGLADRVIRSGVDREFDHDSDHLPVVTSFDLSIKQHSREPRKNWKSIDEKKFKSVVLRKLPPLRRPGTRSALDQYAAEIVAALQNAIETAVPQRMWSPKARRGWDEECMRVLAEAKRLRRLHSLYHTDETWEAYRKARNHKGRVIKKALRRGHRENVEKASESPEALWKMARWARNRNAPAPEVTPALQHPDTLQMTSDTAEKADIFRRAFFPCPPEADISDIEGAVYPERIDMPAITEQEVERAIREASPLKAPGPDSIPNKALQLVTTWIKPHLAALFNQSLTLGYCPQHFRESTTVVLRKHGKDNYTVPGSYRPIGLLNTIGKIMDAIIANRLSYVAETYDLLPVTHIGGRKLRSAEHAIHHIIDKIYEAWNRGQGQVASLLLLDVSGAFDNISHKRLLHNLRKRRIDEKTVRWISSLLEDRHTRVSLDGFKTERHKVSTGTVQGSPLSPILYIFYNADLIERCNLAEDTTATGFIDDVAILTWGDNTTETCAKLQCALQTAEQWAKTHASVFSPNKFQLIHFTRARTRVDTQHPLRTAWGEIQAKPTCKYLGVTMDSALRWKPHIDEIRRKVTKTISALCSLGGSTWGLTFQDMRKIYRGVVVPQIMYACSAWSNANWRTRNMPYTNKTLVNLQSLQARAARLISGAFKATSTPALDIETHLLPIEHQIWKHNIECLGRIGLGEQDLREEEPQHGANGQRIRKTRMSPRKAIQKAIQDEQGFNIKRLEVITPHFVPPWWTSPKTFIEESAEKAQERHQYSIDNEPSAIHIYTDGSGINGHVGAAAVCTTTSQIKSAYMGDDAVSTVYAGELQGISLALQIAQEDRNRGNIRNKVLIYTDNQAAIRSVARPTETHLQRHVDVGVGLPWKISACGIARYDISWLVSTITDYFNFDRVKPNLKRALADGLQSSDLLIWDLAATAACERTPSPQNPSRASLELHLPKARPMSYRELAAAAISVMRAFYPTRDILVMDALILHEALRDDDLAYLMAINTKDLHKICGKLREDGFLTVHTRLEQREDNSRSSNRTWYYINYRHTIDAIKWRLYTIINEPQGSPIPANEKKEYYCNFCKARWTTTEILDSVGASGFLCHRCNHTLICEADRTSTGHEQSTRLNDQFQFISELLPNIDSSHIPEYDFNTALWKARPVIRDAAHQRAAIITMDGDPNRPMAVKGLTNTGPKSITVNISTSDDTSVAEREAKKARITHQNALPSWMSNSTVTGESFSGTSGVGISAANQGKANKAAIPNTLADTSTSVEIDDYFEKLKAEQAAMMAQRSIQDDEDEDFVSDDEGDDDEFEDAQALGNNSNVGVSENIVLNPKELGGMPWDGSLDERA
ncbi:hypothetical protein H634G_08585 [Metarhizium anisopliae BRIP 53293]|uniref:Reverse transcriptase domain-containing protein n=1 Tax=Metarhizium anisopliae BRIP 53293 TaxID=1291518 RepID=A0A0D9NQF1_METAN|nr:hypothetical protein H634G_08585 [Metarhizium anisopliae BRIP 53293]